MNDLPVMLKVAGRLCVVVGGGAVAARRITALKECGARVRVIAPDIQPSLPVENIEVVPRRFQSGDLYGAFLVIVATNDELVNQRIAEEAARKGILVNRADDPTAGDVTIPAHSRHGPVTLAVSTGGVSATAATAIRRELDAALDPDWPRLLKIIVPYRERIQDRFAKADERTAHLVRLTDAEMMRVLKSVGEAGVRARAESLLAETMGASR